MEEQQKQEQEEEIKVEHHPARNYANHHATGSVLGGPSPDGLYHLMFYADAFVLYSETGRKLREVDGKLVTAIDSGGIKMFREDKVTISMSEDTVRQLLDMLQNRVNFIDDAKLGKEE